MPQMSIAMAADSTQRRKRKSKDSDKKFRRDKNVSSKASRRSPASARGSYDDHDSDRSEQESDLDIEKELKPIGGYIDDRHDMVEHMFRSISKKKVRAMLPEILRSYSNEDLKKLCERQLLVMSRKRIMRILEGTDIDAISSSDDSEINREEDNKTVEEPEYGSIDIQSPSDRGDEPDVAMETVTGDEDSCSTCSGSASDSEHSSAAAAAAANVRSRSGSRSLIEYSEDGEVIDSDEGTRKIVALPTDDAGICVATGDSAVQDTTEHVDMPKRESVVNIQASENKTALPMAAANTGSEVGQGQEAGKTQFELLELEMRARAIKAMLHKMEKVSPATSTAAAPQHTDPPAPSDTADMVVKNVTTKNTSASLRKDTVAAVKSTSIKTISSRGSASGRGQGQNRGQGSQHVNRSLSLDMIMQQQAVLQAKIEDARKLANARVADKVKAPNSRRGDDSVSSSVPAPDKIRRASHTAVAAETGKEENDEKELANDEQNSNADMDDLTLTSDSEADNKVESITHMQPIRTSIIRLSPNSEQVQARRLQRLQSHGGTSSAPLPTTRGRGYYRQPSRPRPYSGRGRGRGAVAYYMPSSRSYQRMILQAAIAWRGGYGVMRGQGQRRGYRRR